MSDKQSRVINLTEVTAGQDLVAGYASVRTGSAVVPGQPINGYDWSAIINYDAVRAAATDTGTFSSTVCTIPPLNMAVPALPVELDPPEHLKYRRLLVPELRPDRVAKWSDAIRRAVDEALDEFIDSGEGDLVAIARHVPPTIFAAILGVPDDGPIMVDLTERLNRCAETGDSEQRALVNKEFTSYLERIVDAAKDSERSDLLALIANATVDGEPISHTNALAMTLSAVVAGQETTINGIAGVLALLGLHPHIKQQILDDRGLVPAAVEEALRLQSPVQMMGRIAMADVEVDGCPISKGDRVGLLWGAANLDPAKFENPGEFRLDRGANPHMAFGFGIHRCVGEHLARLEMVVALEHVLDRIPDYELAGEIEWGANFSSNRGARSIPVRFTSAPRSTAS